MSMNSAIDYEVVKMEQRQREERLDSDTWRQRAEMPATVAPYRVALAGGLRAVAERLAPESRVRRPIASGTRVAA